MQASPKCFSGLVTLAQCCGPEPMPSTYSCQRSIPQLRKFSSSLMSAKHISLVVVVATLALLSSIPAVKVSDLEVADFSEMDEDEAGAHEALTQMLAASTHQGPSSSDLHKKEDNGPEKSTGACAELDKKDSADEALVKPTSPAKPTVSLRSQNQPWFKYNLHETRKGSLDTVQVPHG
jgi:hypothetical protein